MRYAVKRLPEGAAARSGSGRRSRRDVTNRWHEQHGRHGRQRLVQRLRRLAMLDTTVFDEVRTDANATIPAIVVAVRVDAACRARRLALVGVRGLSTTDRGKIFVKSLILGSILSLVLWVVWVGVTYVMLTQVFRARADMQELVRVMGFAAAPLALGVLMFIPVLDFGIGLARRGARVRDDDASPSSPRPTRRPGRVAGRERGGVRRLGDHAGTVLVNSAATRAHRDSSSSTAGSDDLDATSPALPARCLTSEAARHGRRCAPFCRRRAAPLYSTAMDLLARIRDEMAFEGNVRKSYVYRFLMEFQLWWPIWVIYLQKERGLSLTQITLLDTPFFLLIVLAEVPTGAIADRFGRRVSLMLGSALFAVAVVRSSASPTTTGSSSLSYTAWGLALTFQSGADTAILYDSLKRVGREDDFQKINGRLLGGDVARRADRDPHRRADRGGDELLVADPAQRGHRAAGRAGRVLDARAGERERDESHEPLLPDAVRNGMRDAWEQPALRYIILFSGDAHGGDVHAAGLPAAVPRAPRRRHRQPGPLAGAGPRRGHRLGAAGVPVRGARRRARRVPRDAADARRSQPRAGGHRPHVGVRRLPRAWGWLRACRTPSSRRTSTGASPASAARRCSRCRASSGSAHAGDLAADRRRASPTHFGLRACS